MPGIVLLDEDQQRALSIHSSERPQGRPTRAVTQPMQYQPRRMYHRGSAENPLPRTDFTTRTANQTEFSLNEGLPRTDFTRAASTDTYNSSIHSGRSKHRGSGAATATVDFSGSEHEVASRDAYFDSYPMLRGDNIRSSTGSVPGAAGPLSGTSSVLKISVRWIVLGVAIGIALGAVLSEMNVSDDAVRWVNLPGDLFLRMLKCLIVPYVFSSVAVAIGDIVYVGKASIIGWQTAKILVMLWIATVAMGISVALLFRGFFKVENRYFEEPTTAMGLKCQNGLMASMTTNGSVICSVLPAETTLRTNFTLVDVDNVFKNSTEAVHMLDLTEELMHIITPIVSSNIFISFAQNEMLSVITFSMFMGAIAGRNYFKQSRQVNYLYLVLLQLRNSFFLMMEWTIWFTPVACASIVAGTFAANNEYLGFFGHMYPYVLVALFAGVLQAFVIYPLIMFMKTGCQPYRHMRDMLKAYAFAFACASSLATMPVTLSCVRNAKMCSQSITNFVISIGVVSSVSGMGFYIPIAVIYMVESSGNSDKLTALRIVGLALLSLLACAGTPPIPAAGLAVISTAYTTLFGELPPTFICVTAMDFFFDRIVTTCNVNDDIIALKIISENTDETVAQDRLGERI